MPSSHVTCTSRCSSEGYPWESRTHKTATGRGGTVRGTAEAWPSQHLPETLAMPLHMHITKQCQVAEAVASPCWHHWLGVASNHWLQQQQHCPIMISAAQHAPSPLPAFPSCWHVSEGAPCPHQLALTPGACLLSQNPVSRSAFKGSCRIANISCVCPATF
jgi:hypothetical protein